MLTVFCLHGELHSAVYSIVDRLGGVGGNRSFVGNSSYGGSCLKAGKMVGQIGKFDRFVGLVDETFDSLSADSYDECRKATFFALRLFFLGLIRFVRSVGIDGLVSAACKRSNSRQHCEK